MLLSFGCTFLGAIHAHGVGKLILDRLCGSAGRHEAANATDNTACNRCDGCEWTKERCSGGSQHSASFRAWQYTRCANPGGKRRSSGRLYKSASGRRFRFL
jgi:hypothetical protein